jgi:hypothetical protein
MKVAGVAAYGQKTPKKDNENKKKKHVEEEGRL